MIEDKKIRELLISLFEKIGTEYKAAFKELKKDGSWVAFDVGELDQQEYALIKKYFLENYNSGKDLHLDKLGFPEKWTSEDIFDRVFSNFLEWVGFEVGLNAKKSEVFLQEFEARLKLKPVEVVWIPLFRLDLNNGIDFGTPINVGPLSVLTIPGPMDRELLKREFVVIRDKNGYPPGFYHMVNHLAIKAILPIGSNRAEMMSKVMSVIEEVKVLMTGLFGVSLDTPFYFSGTESAWCKFDSQGGGRQPYNFDQEKNNYRSLGEDQLHAIRHHVENIGYEHIKRFRVTSARLAFMAKRENPMDEVVDCAVAIEGLFGSSEVTAKMCLAVSFLVSDVSKERIEIYEKLKDLFVVRGEIVHGNTLEGNKDAVKRYKAMSSAQAKKELDSIADIIKKALLVLMLNRELYDSKKRTHFILGNQFDVIRSPYSYREPKKK